MVSVQAFLWNNIGDVTIVVEIPQEIAVKDGVKVGSQIVVQVRCVCVCGCMCVCVCVCVCMLRCVAC